MALCTLSGQFSHPDATPVNGGLLVLTLSQDAIESGTSQVAPTIISLPLNSNGTISGTPQVYANDGLSPAGTIYFAKLYAGYSTSNGVTVPDGPSLTSFGGGGFYITGTSFNFNNYTPIAVNVTIPNAGQTGATGATGATGSNGTNGTNGSNGANGTSNVPWLDIQNYGGIPKAESTISATTTFSSTSGSPNITVGSALTHFVNGAGVCMWKAGAATTQSTPSAPTITAPPVSGSQTITYQIVGVDAMGGLTAASSSATVSAPAIFGPKAIAISSATASAGVVTLNFATPLNTTVAAGMTIHVVGITGSGASWNGIWSLASAPSTSQVTFAVSGATGTGTVTGATGRVSNVALITGISRSSTGVISVTTSQNHNFNVGTLAQPTIVIIEAVSPLNLCGHFVLASTPTGNTFTCNTGNLLAATGILNTNGVNQNNFVNAATATVYEFVQLACPALAGGTTTQYYIYSDSPNPGGSLVLIGKTLYPESHFIDNGPSVGGGFVAPAYVPTTPPGAAQNQLFSTTILSGGGTTSLVLAANVPSSVTGGTIMYDDAPCLMAASNALPSSNGGGQILLSPPASVGSITLPTYIFNSPIVIPSGREIIVSSSMWINETIYQQGYVNWSGNMAAAWQNAPSFSSESRPVIFGLASPMFQVGLLDASQVSGFNFEGIGIAQTLSGMNGAYGLSVFGGFYGSVRNCSFISGTGLTGGTNVPLMFNGNCVSIELEDLTWEGGTCYPNASTVGQGSWVPCIGNIVFRASDNPNQSNFQCGQIYMTGVNNAADRGIMIDNTYGSASVCNAFLFENIWNQAPITPAIMFFGSAAGASDIKIRRIQMDSQVSAVLANWTTLTNVEITNCFAANQTGLVTGNYINGLKTDGLEQQFLQSINSNGLFNGVGQTQNIVTRQYARFNVGSVGANLAPENTLETNTNAQSLGASGVLFAPVLPPTPTASASGSGTFAAGTWLVAIAHVGWDGGEGAISAATTVTVNGSQGIEVSWTFNPAFQGYYIYFVKQGNPTASRNTTLYTSSPATVSSLGFVTGDSAFADGTGLPLINGTVGVLTDQLAIPGGGGTPSTSTSTGIPGQIAWDATHIYVCTAVNTWVRATLATF